MPTLNLLPINFKRHGSTTNCPVCAEQLNLSTIARLGKNCGLFATQTPDQLTLAKLDASGTSVLYYGTIKQCGIIKVYCGPDKRDVSLFHDISTFEKLVTLLAKMKTCPGNQGFDEQVNRRRRSGCTSVIFTGHDGQVVAKEEGNTIRHIDCHGLVHEGLCRVCRKYRKTLTKYENRHSKDSVSKVSNYFVLY